MYQTATESTRTSIRAGLALITGAAAPGATTGPATPRRAPRAIPLRDAARIDAWCKRAASANGFGDAVV